MSKFRGVKKASVDAELYVKLRKHAVALFSTTIKHTDLQVIEITKNWCPGPDLNRHARLHEAQDFKSYLICLVNLAIHLGNFDLGNSQRRHISISRRVFLHILAEPFSLLKITKINRTIAALAPCSHGVAGILACSAGFVSFNIIENIGGSFEVLQAL